MKLSKEVLDQFEEDLQNAKSFNDLMGKNGVIKKLLKQALEAMLEGEMNEHLGYEKHSSAGDRSGNSRNGRTDKMVKTDTGPLSLSIPRDRNGEFEPVVIRKHERMLGPIEDKIISLYGHGMSTRDIQTHVEEIYGLEMSPTMISNITEGVRHLVEEWQARPLEKVYAIVYFDAIHYKIRDNGQIKTKASYTCLGIDLNGKKDMLGIWIGENESASFWLQVFTELRNRGVTDILIACVDGLKGFPDAIATAFPQTEVQSCVIHQIRNSFRYLASRDTKEFMADLKKIYTAPTEQKASFELSQLTAKWEKKYPIVTKSWNANWPTLSTFFKYPEEIRKIIYTTNAVEGLHRQFRKVTKTKGAFPSDDAVTKMLFLAFRDIQKKWTMPVKNWAFAISQFSIIFNDRIASYL